MERHILRERTYSSPISSSWSQGVPTLAPSCKPYHQRRHQCLWSAVHPWLDSRFWLGWLSKSEALLSPCLLITTWQLFKAHRVTRNEPKIHINSHYITGSQKDHILNSTVDSSYFMVDGKIHYIYIYIYIYNK